MGSRRPPPSLGARPPNAPNRRASAGPGVYQPINPAAGLPPPIAPSALATAAPPAPIARMQENRPRALSSGPKPSFTPPPPVPAGAIPAPLEQSDASYQTHVASLPPPIAPGVSPPAVGPPVRRTQSATGLMGPPAHLNTGEDHGSSFSPPVARRVAPAPIRAQSYDAEVKPRRAPPAAAPQITR